jgi:hypothetical protein
MEFTAAPICTASRQYQRLKLEQIAGEDLTDQERDAARQRVLEKSCICHDLAGGATLKYGIDPAATPAICCGPNIVNFSRIATLEEMVGHIYGRISLLTNPARPHMFLRELALYIDYLRQQIEKQRLGLVSYAPQYFREFKENLQSGIEHYRRLADRLAAEVQGRFLGELARLRETLATVSVGP